MIDPDKNPEIINRLVYMARTYDDVTKSIVSSKNRLQQMIPDADVKHQVEIQNLESIKDRLGREMAKMLEFWPVWTAWAKNVPGFGPFIAANMVILYYYSFVPVCKSCGGDLEKDESGDVGKFVCTSCGKEAKGDGNLDHKIGVKDFPCVSSWWHYLGLHCDETGVKPKRKKGMKQTWSSRGRNIAWHLSNMIVRQQADHPYKAYYLKRKERARPNPDVTLLHRHNMAKNEAVKLMLSHWWDVARTLDGLDKPKPWVLEHGGHVHHIAPYYWEPSGQ